MKIVVTGGNGRIGRYVVGELKKFKKTLKKGGGVGITMLGM